MTTRRKRKAENSPERLSLETPLTVSLLKRWSLGELSAQAVQELADAALRSGCHRLGTVEFYLKLLTCKKQAYGLKLSPGTAPDLQELGRLGACGNAPGNIQRDMIRRFFGDVVVPQPQLVATVAKVGGSLEQPVEIPVLLPDHWVEMLCEHAMEDAYIFIFADVLS